MTLTTHNKETTTSLIIGNFEKQVTELTAGIETLNKYTLQDLSTKFHQYRQGAVDVIRLLDDKDLRENLIWQIDQIGHDFNASLQKKLEEQEYSGQANQFTMF
jgi:hypothetical protein